MKSIKYFLIALLALFTFNSCETTELDLTNNPNFLSPEQADVNFFLNAIQVDFANNVLRFGRVGSQLTRLSQMSGSGNNYLNTYSAASFNGAWSGSYSQIIADVRAMNAIAEQDNLTKHIGIGQVIEAYTLITLVDYFGDVPYSEIIDPTNLNPKLDSGESVYQVAISLLNQAISNFGEASPNVDKDFYYDNNYANWIKLANTIKMKVYIQTRLVDANAIASFNTIVASGNYIISESDNFVFNYSTEFDNPNSRHPDYNNAYQTTGTSGYQSNWLMDYMLNDKSIADPRIRYYFYRQRNSIPTNPTQQFNLLSCALEDIPQHYAAAGAVFCYPGFPVPANGLGYWGRDHGLIAGIPGDSRLRTAIGIYPAGGRFDDNSFAGINNRDRGALGAGVAPILISSTVDFWRAEAALFGGTGTPATHIANGIQKSISYVRTFTNRSADVLNPINPVHIPDLADDATYIAEVVSRVNNAGGNNEVLDILGKEFLVSLFGNGIDAFNYYRRTGYPTGLQPHRNPSPGDFIRSNYYPANAANNNVNIPQKDNVTTPVFWDTNSASNFPFSN